MLDQRYGAGPRCLLDVFPAGDRTPVLFFIHGGYWRALDKSYVSFIAEPFRSAGFTVVIPGYDLVPLVRVGEIVDQIRAAFHWVVEQMTPERVIVAGHSAGGQLAAMLALDQAVSRRWTDRRFGRHQRRRSICGRCCAPRSTLISCCRQRKPLRLVRCFASRPWRKTPRSCPCSALSAAMKRWASSSGPRTLWRRGAPTACRPILRNRRPKPFHHSRCAGGA